MRQWHDVVAGKHGGDRGNQHTGGKSDNVRLANEATAPKSEYGNSRAYLLRRLNKEAPGLYQEVLDGRMSANKAAIEAGIRKPPRATLASVKRLADQLADEDRIAA